MVPAAVSRGNASNRAPMSLLPIISVCTLKLSPVKRGQFRAVLAPLFLAGVIRWLELQ